MKNAKNQLSAVYYAQAQFLGAKLMMIYIKMFYSWYEDNFKINNKHSLKRGKKKDIKEIINLGINEKAKKYLLNMNHKVWISKIYRNSHYK